jgi:hypothetical protein
MGECNDGNADFNFESPAEADEQNAMYVRESLRACACSSVMHFRSACHPDSILEEEPGRLKVLENAVLICTISFSMAKRTHVWGGSTGLQQIRIFLLIQLPWRYSPE